MTVCINDSCGNGDDHEKGSYEGNLADPVYNYPDNAGEYGRDRRQGRGKADITGHTFPPLKPMKAGIAVANN